MSFTKGMCTVLSSPSFSSMIGKPGRFGTIIDFRLISGNDDLNLIELTLIGRRPTLVNVITKNFCGGFCNGTPSIMPAHTISFGRGWARRKPTQAPVNAPAIGTVLPNTSIVNSCHSVNMGGHYTARDTPMTSARLENLEPDTEQRHRSAQVMPKLPPAIERTPQTSQNAGQEAGPEAENDGQSDSEQLCYARWLTTVVGQWPIEKCRIIGK